jgi:23S rRNA (guanosine2251-2'-O)-methyltransferase
MVKLGAAELRTTKSTDEERKKIKKNPIYIILDNVMDTYNIGSIFRLADAVSAEKVILCGQTETPPHTRIKKASINTTEWVSWEYAPTAKKAIEDLRLKISPSGDRQDLRIISIEQSPKSVQYDKEDYSFPIALVVGHETTGVSKEVLEISDQIVEIPMWGVNKSLNVVVSVGIVLYEAAKKLRL